MLRVPQISPSCKPIVALFAVLLVGCPMGETREEEGLPDTIFHDSTGIRRRWEGSIDAVTVAPGDSVRGLVVDSVAVSMAYDSTAVGTVKLRGEFVIVGQITAHPDTELNALCFEAESVSKFELPRLQGDNRRPWFCFSNISDARRLLAPFTPGRMYRVVLDQFTIHRGLTDQTNSARLRHVLSHSP